MQVVERSLSEIHPYEKNPRINRDAVKAVADSIGEYGFRQPIVVDEDGVIIAGHTRYQAAQRLELETVPVHVAEGLTPEQARAYRIMDNRSHENATWDMDLLKFEFDGLLETGHSTQKPLECMARPIRNHTKPKGKVYDPFLGSGTTLVAAQQLGRIGYGIEISPAYVDVACQRLEKHVGEPARKVAEV